MTITRTVARAVREDISSAITDVLNRHGLSLQDSSARFGERDMTLKLDLSVEGRNPREEDFKKYAACYGLDPSDFGRTFRQPGSPDTFKITGLALRARKNTVIVESSKGKEYVMSHRMVAMCLNQEKAA